eukprot:scaffold67457_cov90-Attheya_sp.AAC.1
MARGDIILHLPDKRRRRDDAAAALQEGQSTIIISFGLAFRSSDSSWSLLSAAGTLSTRHWSVACLKGGRTGIALLGLHIHHPLGTSLQMESDNASESAW